MQADCLRGHKSPTCAGHPRTSTVDVGTNGGVAYTRPVLPPLGSNTQRVTTEGYNAAGWLQDANVSLETPVVFAVGQDSQVYEQKFDASGNSIGGVLDRKCSSRASPARGLNSK